MYLVYIHTVHTVHGANACVEGGNLTVRINIVSRMPYNMLLCAFGDVFLLYREINDTLLSEISNVFK